MLLYLILHIVLDGHEFEFLTRWGCRRRAAAAGAVEANLDLPELLVIAAG